MRRAEKRGPEVPNDCTKKGEGNGRTVWLKQICWTEPIIMLFLLDASLKQWSFCIGV